MDLGGERAQHPELAPFPAPIVQEGEPRAEEAAGAGAEGAAEVPGERVPGGYGRGGSLSSVHKRLYARVLVEVSRSGVVH